jgi:hypothetical protein
MEPPAIGTNIRALLAGLTQSIAAVSGVSMSAGATPDERADQLIALQKVGFDEEHLAMLSTTSLSEISAWLIAAHPSGVHVRIVTAALN